MALVLSFGMLLTCLINLLVFGFESTFYYCGCRETSFVSNFDNIFHIQTLKYFQAKPATILLNFPQQLMRGFASGRGPLVSIQILCNEWALIILETVLFLSVS